MFFYPFDYYKDIRHVIFLNTFKRVKYKMKFITVLYVLLRIHTIQVTLFLQ